MRYTIIALFLMTIPGLNASAQGREFGIRAGVSAAQTYNNSELVEAPLPTFYAGAYLGRPLGSTFFTSFISGLEYTQNGYLTDKDNLRRLHYVGVPLALRFHFGPFHLQPGVNANFKVAEKLMEGGISVLDQENKSSWFDLPIQLGVGVKIMDVAVEFRFQLGWMDVNQGNKNSSLQLGLAYAF